jgi:hypothetical protein
LNRLIKELEATFEEASRESSGKWENEVADFKPPDD